jgi:hypothetical protein
MKVSKQRRLDAVRRCFVTVARHEDRRSGPGLNAGPQGVQACTRERKSCKHDGSGVAEVRVGVGMARQGGGKRGPNAGMLVSCDSDHI